MRVLLAAGAAAKTVEEFESEGFKVSVLGGAVHSVVAALDPGGRIGRHRAVVDQVLVVVAGAARVAGEDQEWVEVGPGQMAIWRAGESHETRSDLGVVAIILEAGGLADAFA
jgi:quercetin dioxygenase-like cupin family protein